MAEEEEQEQLEELLESSCKAVVAARGNRDEYHRAVHARWTAMLELETFLLSGRINDKKRRERAKDLVQIVRVKGAPK